MTMHKVKLATLLINLTCSASLFAAGGINSGFSGSGGINQGPATSNSVASAGAAMLGGTNNFTGPNSFTNTGNSFVGSFPDSGIVNVKSFGLCGNGKLVGNGIVTSGLTNLFCTNSAFLSSDVGKLVRMWGAGAIDISIVNTNYPFGTNTYSETNYYDLVTTISAFVNPSNVTLALAAGHSTTNNFAYGNDETAVIQAGWNYVTTNSASHWLQFPNGVYITGTNFTERTAWTNHNCSIITTPLLPDAGVYYKSVGMLGVCPQTEAAYQNYPVTQNGSIIVSMANGSNTNLYRWLDTRPMQSDLSDGGNNNLWRVTPLAVNGYMPKLNAINIQIENMAFVSGYDANMVSLDLTGTKNCTVEGSLVTDGTTGMNGSSGLAAKSGTNGWGIMFPQELNENFVFFDKSTVFHMYNGIADGGNLSSYSSLIEDAWNGVIGTDNARASVYIGLQPQAVKNCFVGGLCLNASDIEPQDTAVSWASYQNLIVQTNWGQAIGFISYKNNSTIGNSDLSLPCFMSNGGGMLVQHFGFNGGYTHYETPLVTDGGFTVENNPNGSTLDQTTIAALDLNPNMSTPARQWHLQGFSLTRNGGGIGLQFDAIVYPSWFVEGVNAPYPNLFLCQSLAAGYSGGETPIPMPFGQYTKSIICTNDVTVLSGGKYNGNGSGITNLTPSGISSGTGTPVAVTVGASPFTFANTTGARLECHLSGTIAYSVTKNGAAVYGSLAGDCYACLQTNAVLVITYGTAPTLFTNSW